MTATTYEVQKSDLLHPSRPWGVWAKEQNGIRRLITNGFRTRRDANSWKQYLEVRDQFPPIPARKVYAADRQTVIATVSPRCLSIGAAKAAGYRQARYERVEGEWSWVVVGEKLPENQIRKT